MTNQSIRVSPGHLIGLLVLLAGCTTAPTLGPSNKHIGTEPAKPAAPVATIPQPVDIPAALPRPKAVPRLDTYSVVVNNVKVQELLFALARDAKINVDVHPGLDGTITLNAIDQTLPHGARGDEQPLELAARRQTGQLVEQAGEVRAHLLVVGEQAEVLIEAGRLGGVVAGADVAIAPQALPLLTHDECQLAAVSYTHPPAPPTLLDLVCRLLLVKKKKPD